MNAGELIFDEVRDVAGLIVRHNAGQNFSVVNYEAKAQRWKTQWPEITVLSAEG